MDRIVKPLLAASRLCTVALDAEFRLERPDGCADWSDLIGIALAHGLGGLLCAHMLTAASGDLPDDIADAARAHIAFLRTAHAAGIAELLDLLALFSDAGIVVVPFKGPVLAQQFFPDPALRRFTDLDLLIAPTDAEPAHRLMSARGYRSQHQDLRPRHLRAYWRYNGQDVLHAPDRLPVEPHWLLGQRTLATHLDMPGFLARATSITLGGMQVPTLSVEDSLIAACFHGAKDEWQSLRTVVDVAAILSGAHGLDWDQIRRRATAGGVWRMVLIGVELAEILLDVRPPAAIARDRAADRTAATLADQVTARLFRADAPLRSVFELSAFRWRMRERLRDRVGYVAATVLTPRTRQFRTVDLPDALCFLYPVVKVMQDHVLLPLKDRLRRGVAP